MEDVVAMFLESIERTESDILNSEIDKVNLSLYALKKDKYYFEKILMFNKLELEVCCIEKEELEKKKNRNKKEVKDIHDLTKVIKLAEEKIEVTKEELERKNEKFNEYKEEKERLGTLEYMFNRVNMDEELCLAFRTKV